MAKDPILPLYYNDFRGATLDWTDEEVGAYIRLLIYQWDAGFIPNDKKRLERICSSFTQTWPLLSTKFSDNDGKLQNQRLEIIRDTREKHKQKQSDNVKKRWSKKEPNVIPETYQMFTKEIPLENENENENENEKVFEIESKRGDKLTAKSEIVGSTYLVPNMLNIFTNYKPKYLVQRDKDFPALLKIASSIASASNLSFLNDNDRHSILDTWEQLVSFIITDSFYKDFSITQIEKYLQAIANKLGNSSSQNMGKIPIKAAGVMGNNVQEANKAKLLLKKLHENG
ncbi:DUF1376 domain-containing protein [Chitinophaga skermanii]|nr:DUF1376 domain-containing protein [Chitinophaga skermanii]